MPSLLKRSVRISKHSTSLSLEPEFWDELKRLARLEKLSLNQLVTRIDRERKGNLSSALRLYVLRELKSALRRAE
jgi:predicted DNA-binding ribbon-helix-helix protein